LSWTYRIVDHGQHFALHSVKLDEQGRPREWVRRAIDFACDLDCGPQGIVQSLEEALSEARGHPVMREVQGTLEEVA